MAEYLIVTGLSGAGRTTAAATLEDLGWFVIDGLPPALLGRVAEIAAHGDFERLCIVAGRGGADSVQEMVPALDALRATGARVRLLFLDASDDVLVRRFEGARRRHPVVGEGVLDAIRAERELFRPLKEAADFALDTSELNVNELRSRLVELFSVSGVLGAMETSVVSFGYKYGLPPDVDLVLDCRFLPNPYWLEELRPKSGLDEEVRQYVLDQPDATEFLERVRGLLAFLLPAYVKEGKSYLSIAIGCTGGRHRSVVVAEELGTAISDLGYHPTVHHRDIDR